MEERALVKREGTAIDRTARRWALARDVIALQLKLVLEGIRDVVLGPLGLIAGLAGVLTDPERPARLFRGVLRGGVRFDRWLNLFGALERCDAHDPEEPALPVETSADDWLNKIEQAVVDQYERGSLTRSAKDRIDRLIGAAQKRTSP